MRKEFTWIEGLAFCLAWIGIQLCSEMLNQWGAYFYSPPADSGRIVYVSIGLVGTMFIIGAIWEGLTNPIVGALSDRTPPRPKLRWLRVSGRRRPFIFWGSVLMMFSLVAVWYPPVGETSSTNFYYGVVMLCCHWLFFSMTSIPILALAPEVATTTESRVKLGIWVAVGSILGIAIANALSGEFLVALSPEGSTQATPEGYRKLAVIYAVAAFGTFQFLVWTVRERYNEHSTQQHKAPLKSEMRDVARNRPFIIYCIVFILFYTGIMGAQRSLPYWSEVGLGGNEGTITMLLLPFILACLLTYPFVPLLTRRLGIKWTVFLSILIVTVSLPLMYPIALSDAPSSTKILWGAALFGITGVGQGISFVMLTPLVGEIVDYDAYYSGEKREALYNGLTHLSWKVGQAGAVLMATQSMNLLGNNAQQPLGIFLIGPIAGLCGLGACVAMLFYPRSIPRREDAA
jgi:GPH family glycoside/pentoside/hexuronide:cation symporter